MSIDPLGSEPYTMQYGTFGRMFNPAGECVKAQLLPIADEG